MNTKFFSKLFASAALIVMAFSVNAATKKECNTQANDVFHQCRMDLKTADGTPSVGSDVLGCLEQKSNTFDTCIAGVSQCQLDCDAQQTLDKEVCDQTFDTAQCNGDAGCISFIEAKHTECYVFADEGHALCSASCQ